MAVSTFTGAGGAAGGLTDQGGEVVLARFKQGSIAIPVSDLAAGSYFATFQGAGSLQIGSYASGTTGPVITAGLGVSGTTTTQITIPAGVDGITITGTYNGPVVFQTIASAASVAFGALQILATDFFEDFTSQNWRPIPNSPYMMTWNNSYSSIANIDTKTIVTSTNQIYRPNGSTITGANSWIAAYNPSTGTILFPNGYGGGTTSSVYRSTNGGQSWSNALSLTAHSYAYWDNAQFEGNNFYITAGWTGQNQGVRHFYVSANDGVTWTLNSPGYSASGNTNTGLRKILYSPSMGYWAFSLIHPSGSNSQSYTATIWQLSSDGTSVDAVIDNYPIDSNYYVNAELLPANQPSHGEVFMLVTQSGAVAFSNSTGSSYTQAYASGWASYSFVWDYGEYYFTNSYVGADANGNYKVQFGRRDNNSWYLHMQVPYSGSISTIYYPGSPYSYPYNLPQNFSQVANDPTTGDTRVNVWLNGTDYGNRLASQLGNTVTSPSGFGGNYNTTNSSPYGSYCPKADRYFFIDQSQRLWASEIGGSPTPTVLIDSNTNTTALPQETESGVLFYWRYDGYIFTSSDKGNTWSSYYKGSTFPSMYGYAQGASYGNTIIIADGNTTSNNGKFLVSQNNGSTWVSITMPQTGTNELFGVFSDSSGFFVAGYTSGKLYDTETGLVYTDTGRTIGSVNVMKYKANNTYFSNHSGSNWIVYLDGTRSRLNQSALSGYNLGFVALGPNGFAAIPQLASNQNVNYIYTSENAVTWTIRYVLGSYPWTGGVGGDKGAVAVSGHSKLAQVIETSQSVTVG